MTKKNGVSPAVLFSLMALALRSCRGSEFQLLPDGVNSLNVGLSWDDSEWSVTVRNKYGSASDRMFAANDHQRSNIYLTSTNQLVVIEQGGSDTFFQLFKDRAPEALEGEKYKERNTHSDNWHYVGLIKHGSLTLPDQEPECIALLGEGNLPYRKKYQITSFC